MKKLLLIIGLLLLVRYCEAGTFTIQSAAGSGDVTSVGDCTSGACYDGTSDGGTYLKYYDAQGAGQLIIGDLTAARVWTLPDNTGTVLTTGSTSASIQSIIGASIYQPYDADLTTYAGIPPSANAQTLLGQTYAQMASSMGALTASSISDAIYGAGWDGDTTTAPSKNAVYDKIATLAGGFTISDVLDGLRYRFQSFGQSLLVGTTNIKRVIADCTITGWTLVASGVSNTTVDILKSNLTDYGNWTSVFSMNTTASNKGNSSGLSYNLSAGDYVMGNVTASNLTGMVEGSIFGQRR